MASESLWRSSDLDHIVRISPSPSIRSLNEAFNTQVLSKWEVPEAQRYATCSANSAENLLGDANANMTAWFLTVTSLVEEAMRRGLNPSTSQFIDVGCGVGLTAVYAVEALGFSSALGIEYEEERVHEALTLISRAAVASRTKDRVSILHADAAAFSLPPPTGQSRFVFMFNSFGPKTLHAFIRTNFTDFTPADVMALANDVTLLAPLVDALPGCTWVRNDAANSSLVYPRGHAQFKAPDGNESRA